MNPELPEGPLTDKNGKKWDYKETCRNWPSGQVDGAVIHYGFTPHVERFPLFIDLAGHPVHEGDDKCYAYDYLSKKPQEHHVGNRGREVESAIKGTEQLGPSFKHKSDCEKWVASNVKRNTDKEMYEWAVQKVEEIIKKSGNFYANNIVTELKGLIQEKCL